MKRAIGFFSRQRFILDRKPATEAEAAEYIKEHGPQPIWNSKNRLYAKGGKVYEG